MEKWEIDPLISCDIITRDSEGFIKQRIARCLAKGVEPLIASAPETKQERDELLEACKRARELYDHLALGTLEAACKYGDNYEPPTDEDWLNMRTGLEQAIANATEER